MAMVSLKLAVASFICLSEHQTRSFRNLHLPIATSAIDDPGLLAVEPVIRACYAYDVTHVNQPKLGMPSPSKIAIHIAQHLAVRGYQRNEDACR